MSGSLVDGGTKKPAPPPPPPPAAVVHRPGRLGDDEMVLKTDPRCDPRLVKALAKVGLDGAPPAAKVTIDSPLEDVLADFAEAEKGFRALFAGLFDDGDDGDLPDIGGDVVERSEVTVEGADGNDVRLYIHRPADVEGPVPCIYHTHGGGMCIMTAAEPVSVRWRDELAASGLVVVGVEFRNSAGALGNHPFPAGLNDCMTGLRWTHENRAALGVSRIVTCGESGGGNLALALALKAKREGSLDLIDGTYALCPFISNACVSKPPELPSLIENDGYFIDTGLAGRMAMCYDPAHENDRNPLCWPYVAETDDLRGLRPTCISVNELDPVRDEGLAYYRKLAAAGVPSLCRTVNGSCHAADVIFRKALPDMYAATVRDIKGFAESL